MFSTQVSRASARLLLVGGLALLFVPDAILPRLVPGFPAAEFWLGQLLAAALLALAALDWLQRSALLGGIYGRPVVTSNAAFYFIAAMVLLRRMVGREAPVASGSSPFPSWCSPPCMSGCSAAAPSSATSRCTAARS